MKCPLFTLAEIVHEPELKPASNDCLKEECAWWIKDYGRCCVLDGVLCLNSLIDKLEDLNDTIDRGGNT